MSNGKDSRYEQFDAEKAAKEAKDRFEACIKDHKIYIQNDNGNFRHIHCSKGDSVYHFNITTWPGYLCISGDMGCFVFRRELDMFGFFRNKSNGINPYYWSEKLQGPGTSSEKCQEVNLVKAKEVVWREFYHWADNLDVSDETHRDYLIAYEKARIEEEVISNLDSHLLHVFYDTLSDYSTEYDELYSDFYFDTEAYARKILEDEDPSADNSPFASPDDEDEDEDTLRDPTLDFEEKVSELVEELNGVSRKYTGVDFTDFWEYTPTYYTYRYLWACHAIIWAINEYDRTKESEKESDATEVSA